MRKSTLETGSITRVKGPAKVRGANQNPWPVLADTSMGGK